MPTKRSFEFLFLDDSEYKGIEEDEDMDFDFNKMDNESYNMNEAKKAKKIETKEGMKPKVGTGGKIGSSKKFSYKKSKGGFKEDMKHANPTKGTGKPKFEFKASVIIQLNLIFKEVLDKSTLIMRISSSCIPSIFCIIDNSLCLSMVSKARDMSSPRI